MTFLAMVLALVLSLAWPYRSLLHRDRWYVQLGQWTTGLGLQPGVARALQLALPIAVAALVLQQLRSVLFGLPWIAAASVLLLYALGRTNTGQCAESYRARCRRGDFEAAWLAVRRDFPLAVDGEVAPERVGDLHAMVQRALLLEQLRGWFGVLFYFVVLGPVAALAYRLFYLGLAPGQCRRLAHWLDWIPARLLALSFMLTGNFGAGAEAGFAGVRRPQTDAAQLLWAVAQAAAGSGPVAIPEGDGGDVAARDNEELSALVQRSAVCWVLVISLAAMVA